MNVSLDNVREQFPGLRDKVFFDAAGVGIAPRVAVDAIRKFLDQVSMVPVRSMVEQHIGIDADREAARREAALLIGAADDEIAIVESTTHGLSIAARALPLEPGDNIVTCDLEFIEVPLPWRQPSTGIAPEIRLARNVNGALPVSAFETVMDQRTRAVVVSSVQWSNGYRCDLNAISALCRRFGALLVVDAVQELGAFRLDVGKTDVDIVVCGGHKWLNAPFGAGFMYVRRGVSERLRDPVAGYLAVNPPIGGWGAYFETPSITPLQPFELTRDARRFENGGTANYPGGIGLAACIRMIHELNSNRIEAHIRSLTDYLIEGLKSLRLEIVTPLTPEVRSGIITFRLPGGARENIALKEYLLDHRILTAVRYTSGVGGVRISCHFYNTKEDVDRLLNTVETYVKKAPSAFPVRQV